MYLETTNNFYLACRHQDAPVSIPFAVKTQNALQLVTVCLEAMDWPTVGIWWAFCRIFKRRRTCGMSLTYDLIIAFSDTAMRQGWGLCQKLAHIGNKSEGRKKHCQSGERRGANRHFPLWCSLLKHLCLHYVHIPPWWCPTKLEHKTRNFETVSRRKYWLKFGE